VDEALVVAMRDALRHRGPDGAGLLVLPGIGLGHRRLAIIDVAGGDQPIWNEDQTAAIVFNGEIYNYQELMRELIERGHRFRTRSDSEVILHGFEEWGPQVCERLLGMFAFAVYDRPRHRLFLARDRLGKKPLYVRRENGRILFGSELKAILADRSVPRRIRPQAVAEYLALRYVPAPGTVFEGIEKLPAAHWLLAEAGGKVSVQCYWRLSFADPLVQDRKKWIEDILGELDRATRVRLMSEVPLGAFLSGGIDSSAVVASMTRVGTGRVATCSVGFSDAAFDERPHAREMAAFLGADLSEALVTPDPERDLEVLAAHLDDPVGDSSALPTWHVSRITRQRVTVALSGDGGDENFAGYRRYRFDALENRVRRLLPRALRVPVFAGAAAMYPKADWLPRPLRFKRTLQNLARDPAEAYFRSVSCALPEDVAALLAPDAVAACGDPFVALRAAYARADGPDPLSRILATDIQTWLCDDILAKVDRTSMAVSLEVRAPLLDHRFMELCARIPSDEKLRRGEGKAIFKAALRGRLPDSCLDRRKQGFSVPLRRWTRGPLTGVLDQLLAGPTMGTWFRRERVAALLAAHRSGTADHSEILWSLLMFDRWHRRWVDAS
jgi:asparagine synthase (glutamine-hydrolysing)